MIFLDTDVLLDIAWQREPYWKHAADLLDLSLQYNIQLATTPIVLSNMHYLISKYRSVEIATEFNQKILALSQFLSHSKDDFIQAYQSQFRDKEDAVNYFTAKSNRVQFIVTRNKKDFELAEIPVYTPGEMILRM